MLNGAYVGIVESNRDPEKLGRVKVRVAHVYGIPDSDLGGIGINDLPWAIPAGLPAGGSALSGGIDWLPEPGDQVVVMFLDGEPEKPVWMWMMQSIDQSKAFTLHKYKNAAPERAAMTRYGHTIELNSGSVLVATKSGYVMAFINGDVGASNGMIQIMTPKGQLLELDDQNQTLTINVLGDCQQTLGGQWLSIADSMDFTSITGGLDIDLGDTMKVFTEGDYDMTAAGDGTEAYTGKHSMTVGQDASMSVGTDFDITVGNYLAFAFAQLDLGASATEPFVLGNRLYQLFNVLLLWLAAHTHSNGNNGSPTGPPLVAPQGECTGLLNQIRSNVIRGT
jgi:hypothetical protein